MLEMLLSYISGIMLQDLISMESSDGSRKWPKVTMPDFSSSVSILFFLQNYDMVSRHGKPILICRELSVPICRNLSSLHDSHNMVQAALDSSVLKYWHESSEAVSSRLRWLMAEHFLASWYRKMQQNGSKNQRHKQHNIRERWLLEYCQY